MQVCGGVKWMLYILLLVAALTVMSGQSQRDLKLERTAPTTTPLASGKRWALIVGISAYQNAPPHAQLKYAHRDAEDFARFLRSEAGGSIPFTQMRLLTDKGATLSTIRASLHNWLPLASGPNDIVYVFFAGHGVVVGDNEAYFVAHDSDPQNLHATGLSFREVNETLASRLKSKLVILLADACHAGSIGWTADPAVPSRAQDVLESLGRKDQSVLKLLASRPSERSFEDERWDGGHGVFTFALLAGLRGAAEQDRDGTIRVSELIDYVSRVIPEQTEKKQNPRVAGNFEPRLELARLSETQSVAPATGSLMSIDLAGPAGASVYIDRAYRGAIRTAGDLRIDGIAAGAHRLEVELSDGRSFEQTVTLQPSQRRLDLNTLPGFALMRLESMVRTGRILESGGAWDYYKSQTFPPEHRMLADATMSGALENVGQNCVNDYVQSTTAGLKAQMLRQSEEAYRRLQQLRPFDRSLEAKRTFCQGRALIATGRFTEAVASLQHSLRIDPNFACSHNALGVALERLGRDAEARTSYERAFSLAPEWFLPPMHVAQQWIAAGQPKRALPLLEKAVQYNPRAPLAHWTLLRVLRVLKRDEDFLKRAGELTALFPNYAPAWLELAAYHDSKGEFVKAVQAYDAYLTLAPNFEDSTAVRSRLKTIRPIATQPPPSLIRERPPQ